MSNKEIFFGIDNPYKIPEIDAINFIILVAKSFIWNEKRLGRPCTLHDFLEYLREQILLETASKLFKKKTFLSLLCDNFL